MQQDKTNTTDSINIEKESVQHKNIFSKIYRELAIAGQDISPRGLRVLEIENFNYILPPYVRFINFAIRKLNLNYIKQEFLWYLKGDRFDDTICQYAKIWSDIKNKDSSINSNYGQYIFGKENQFDNVIEILKNDKDSRRASIVILNKDHLLSSTTDVPCTYSISFRIRKNTLNMTVRMRSQDSVYGMGNDLPAFSFIHEMMLNALKEFYPELEYGQYYHSVDSFHIYEKHFEMLEKITGIPVINKKVIQQDSFTLILCPQISGPEEVKYLRKLNFENTLDNFKFSKWLNNIS